MFWVFAVAAGVVLFSLWEKIRNWLQTKVANFLESRYGLGVRERFLKTVVTVDRVVLNGKRVVRKVAESILRREDGEVQGVRVIEYDSEGNYTLEELRELDAQGKMVEEFVLQG